MSDSVLNNKRRLERHTRRDSKMQARARPVMKQRSAAQEHDSTVASIRSLVERAHDETAEWTKRLLVGSGTSGDDDDDSTTTGTGSTRGSNGGSSGSTTKASGASADDDDDDDANDNTGSGSRSTTAASPTKSSNSDSDTLDSITSALRASATADSSTRNRATSTQDAATSDSSSRTHTSSEAEPTTSSSAAVLVTTAAMPTSTFSPTTSIAYVSALPTATADSAAASSTAKSDSGVSAGPIIGIVAGSLAGIAVIAALIGFLIKKFGKKEDPYEADPFDRDEFRRHSAMLPDTFESEDGHPSMSEHNNLQGSMGPFSDGHYAGGMAAASAYQAHNESGGPRPPTMFQKHINGPGAQYNMNDAGANYGYDVGGVYDPSPQLPPMAFGGQDPYNSAGVGRNMETNISNPYAHLDRSASTSMPNNAAAMYGDHRAAQEMYGDLDRNGSFGSRNDYQSYPNGFDTAGRPGTAEGRSGTPDLPNVQQTFALGQEGEEQMGNGGRAMSPHHMMASPQHISQDMGYYQGQGYQGNGINNAPGNGQHSPTQPLQVRNLLPNSHRGEARPETTVDDDDNAYGGVW